MNGEQQHPYCDLYGGHSGGWQSLLKTAKQEAGGGWHTAGSVGLLLLPILLLLDETSCHVRKSTLRRLL